MSRNSEHSPFPGALWARVDRFYTSPQTIKYRCVLPSSELTPYRAVHRASAQWLGEMWWHHGSLSVEPTYEAKATFKEIPSPSAHHGFHALP